MSAKKKGTKVDVVDLNDKEVYIVQYFESYGNKPYYQVAWTEEEAAKLMLSHISDQIKDSDMDDQAAFPNNFNQPNKQPSLFSAKITGKKQIMYKLESL